MITDKIESIEATIGDLAELYPTTCYARLFEQIGVLGRESAPVDRMELSQRLRIKVSSIGRPLRKINDKLEEVGSEYRVGQKLMGFKYGYWIEKKK